MDPSVTCFIGPMFSGKTSSMCNAVERHHHAGRRCIIVKYAKDTRYNHLSKSGGVVNHRGDEYSKVPIIPTENLTDVFSTDTFSTDDKSLNNIQVIGIDEAQFFPDAPEVITSWINMGITIIIAALDSNWMAKPFGRIAEIIAISDHVTKLNAVCMRCGKDASFTCKIGGSSEIEEIGGTDKYIAACRKCFNRAK